MAREPIVGSDNNAWGTVLNTFLSVSLNSDGTLNHTALTAAGALTNPMTTAGDIISATTGGTPIRLGIGTNGQVLTVSGGVVTWANSAAGFTNPMTTKGDIIFENATPAPARLPIGSTGQLLGVVGGLPAWTTQSSTVIQPSGDTTGVTDQAAIATALNALTHGGVVTLAPGDFYVTSSSTTIAGFTPPANTCIFLPQQTTAGTTGGGPLSLVGQGAATTIHVVGAGVTGIYAHRSSGYGTQYGTNPADLTGGYIRHLVVSGENPAGTLTATGVSVGIDCGDAWGLQLEDVTVSNFTGTGSIGLKQVLRVFWNEKQKYQVHLLNNDTAMVITTAIVSDTTHHSNEYNYYDITMFCNANQNGIICDGVNMGGCQFFIKGNMSKSNSSVSVPIGSYGTPLAAFAIVNQVGTTVTNEVRLYNGQLWMKVEGNPGNTTVNPPSSAVYPYGIYCDGVGNVQQCAGFISHSLSNSLINNAEFSFKGGIAGDPNLSQAFPGAPSSGLTSVTQPSVPLSGVAQQNYGPDFQVCVSGGTVSGVSVNGLSSGLTSGAFFVSAGASITVNYTVTPSWHWLPASQMSF